MDHAKNRLIERYVYVHEPNAPVRTPGRGVYVEFWTHDIVEVRKWVNSNGNPTYAYHVYTHFNDDRHVVYIAVDEHGGMNDIYRVKLTVVDRRKDLT